MLRKIYFSFFSFLLVAQLNAQTFTDSFIFDTTNREFTVHVPAAYNSANAVPLIISLHGLGDNMANFSAAGFHALSESENFIVVTPQALNYSFSTFAIGNSWNSGVGAQVAILSEPIYPNEDVDDVGFISALIDSLSLSYNIDQDRVYATGFSMGGFMANRLAVELNEKIAAIASVSGTLGDNVSRNNKPCPIPVMHIHGTADATIDYNADYQNGGLYTIVGDSVSGLMNFWNGINQTDTDPIYNASYTTIGGLNVEEYVWENGLDSSLVRHLKVDGGGHTWDSSYPDEIWDFLSVHKNQEVCVISALNDLYATEEFSVYPNPNSGRFQVSTESEIQQISIFNALGERVLQRNTANVDMTKLSNGVYYLEIQTSTSLLKSKLIKE